MIFKTWLAACSETKISVISVWETLAAEVWKVWSSSITQQLIHGKNQEEG